MSKRNVKQKTTVQFKDKMESTTKTYDERKMKLLHDYLKKCAADGKPRYYEIRIDEMRAVPRSNDVTAFNGYLETLDEHSRLVEVFIYNTHQRSFNAEKHRFQIVQPQPEQKPSPELNGFDIDAKIKSAVERERERMEHEKICEELDKTKSDLKEAEEYIKKLRTDLKQYEGKKLHWGNVNLGELASVMVEGMVRRNPQLLTKIPGGEALAGIIEEDNKEREKRGEEIEDAEVTFIKNADSKQPPLSEDQQRFLQVLEMLEEHFDEGELNMVNEVLSKLIEKKEDLRTVAELLGIRMK